MATSSMHKPGWRSRRRSRLSLVERAVPRIGRMTSPDDGSRPAATAEPDSTRTEMMVTEPVSMKTDHADGEVLTELASDLAAPRMHSSPSVIQRLTETLPTPSKAQVDTGTAAEEIAPRRADKQNLDGVNSEHRHGSEPEIKPGALQETTEESGPEPEQADETVMPVQVAGDDRSRFPPEPLALPIKKPLEMPPAAEPDLTLDWPPLVAQGFTDPRDRSRPLPKNMDEIARALIRQALSDQSSWRDRVVLVTSPYERKAKTVAAINFAFGLTTINRHSVVLVDADVDGEGAVDRLGGDGKSGLTTALFDDDLEISDVALETDLDRLTLLGSGPSSEESLLDRFASRRMLQILRFLTKDPETLLVIDAPPIIDSQEAAVLSVIAGQVVLVVEAGRTTADAIDHALQRIGDRPNVALVLNESSGFDDEFLRVGQERADRSKALPDKHNNPVRRRVPKAVAALLLAGCLGLTSKILTENTDRALAARTFTQQDRIPPSPMGIMPLWTKQITTAFGVAGR